MLVWHETTLLSLYSLSSNHRCTCGQGEQTEVTIGSTTCCACDHMESRWSKKVRGFVVKSKKRLNTKIAKHRLNQRLYYSNVSGLATGLLWPTPLKHPNASPSNHYHHSYSKVVKITTQRPQDTVGKTRFVDFVLNRLGCKPYLSV